MDEGPRIFSVEEANRLVPTLELVFGDLARLRSELEQAIRALGGAEIAQAVLEGAAQAPPGREVDADRLRTLADEVGAAVERVHALGCVVKDVESGLVDFYAMREGEPVFLCWQLGEPAVAHWHTLDGGFAARQRMEEVEVEPPRFLN